MSLYADAKNMPHGVYFLAAHTILGWSEEHDMRFPTLEEMQEAPLNFTSEFAHRFVDTGLAEGWLVDDETPQAPGA